MDRIIAHETADVPGAPATGRVLSTLDFAAIGDHARLPWRFFARLHAVDSLIR
jgi:hypothetical protein